MASTSPSSLHGPGRPNRTSRNTSREIGSPRLANIAAALHATSEYLLGLPESGADKPFGAIKAYCALHGGELSEAETRDLIMTPLSARDQVPGQN